MPIYQYECECGNCFDAYKTIEERRKADCPECQREANKVLTFPSMAVDITLTDLNGTPVWYPKNGGIHYDRILKQTFHSKKEKVEYMNQKGLVMDGSESPKSWPVESGDMRSKSYRKSVQSED